MPFFIPIGLAISAAASAAAAAPIATLAIAAGVTGGVMSAMSAQQAGKDAQTMADYNAKVEQQKAKQLEAKAAFDQQRQAEDAARGMGELEVGIGKSGAVGTVGSPLLIAAKQASEYELDNLLIGYEGKIGADAARSQAALDTMEGDIALRRGRNQAIGSYIGAGGSLLGGFASMSGPAGKISPNQGLPRQNIYA